MSDPSLLKNVQTAISELVATPSALKCLDTLAGKLPKNLGISLCIFAIIGNELFDDPSDYAGQSNGISTSLNHIKGFLSWGEQSYVMGVGLTTTPAFSCGSGEAHYDLLGDGKLFGIDLSSIDFGNFATYAEGIARNL